MNDTLGFMRGGGAMSDRMQAFDWSATSLGEPAAWPQSLRTAVAIVLRSVVPIVMLWGEDGVMIYNDSYSVFAGGRHPRLLGSKVREGWPEVADFNDNVMKVGLAGGTLSYKDQELTLHRNGAPEQVWMNLDYSPVLGEDGEPAGVFCVLAETTERVAAEAALRELNASLERRVEERTQERNRIWELSRDMLGIADEGGVWLSVNPAWTQILGWQPDEIAGRTSQWMEHPEDAAKTRSEVSSLAEGTTTFDFENRFRTRDGGYRTLNWTAVPEEGLFYCVARDVTEERRKAADLRLFMNIVESAIHPICAFNTDYRLIAFNKAHSDEFFRIYSHRVRIGDVFPDLFLPDQAPVIRGFMARALAGESYTVTEEFGDPEAARPYWEIVYSPIRDETGRIIGAFHYAQDVSTRLRAQAELADAQQALRQSQKMEAVGQLTGGLAHDFNNLLAGISGSLEMMQARINQGRVKDLDRYMIAAQGAAKRAAALTQRLLAFLRRQTLDPKPTNVNALVGGMQDLVQRTVGPEIAVEHVGASGLWTALVDPSQLEIALLNL